MTIPIPKIHNSVGRRAIRQVEGEWVNRKYLELSDWSTDGLHKTEILIGTGLIIGIQLCSQYLSIQKSFFMHSFIIACLFGFSYSYACSVLKRPLIPDSNSNVIHQPSQTATQIRKQKKTTFNFPYGDERVTAAVDVVTRQGLVVATPTALQNK